MFGLNHYVAVVLVGVLMRMYVLFGGMLATTVQIIKAVLLLFGASFMALAVMKHVGPASQSVYRSDVSAPERGGKGIMSLGRAG